MHKSPTCKTYHFDYGQKQIFATRDRHHSDVAAQEECRDTLPAATYPGKAFGEEELHRAIERGAIHILDDATIAAMKEKRARDKARDAELAQKENEANGETTDWQAALKEWEEYYSDAEKQQ